MCCSGVIEADDEVKVKLLLFFCFYKRIKLLSLSYVYHINTIIGMLTAAISCGINTHAYQDKRSGYVTTVNELFHHYLHKNMFA